jgi:catechol 2,3-dioxygenase-like lactoylglutathione lyase family enzyme
MFTTPQVNIYVRDVERSRVFYAGLGFEETFRTPSEGTPVHVELVLEGFKLGVASAEAGIREHGLDIRLDEPGRGMELVLWTDDTDGAFARLAAAGCRVISEPRDFGQLRVAWVADPDDNPIEVVQRR